MLAEVYLPVPLKDKFTYHTDDGKIKAGCRVIVPFGARKLTGFVTSLSEDRKLDFEVKEIVRAVDKEPVFTPELLETAEWMSRTYLCSPGQVLSAMIPSGRRESESALFPGDEPFVPVEKLSDEQQEALDAILSGEGGTFYLFGVTGSGKSEVYLRAAEETIRKGKKVIYLVPEITLTHQLMSDISSRFRGRVAVLHSALTPSQRLKYWHDAMRGDVDIVIGARSAVFAPFSDIGLIVLDEEHENSYKSSQSPRYHARQVAQKRAAAMGATLIMGSATPSLEAYLGMKRNLMTRLDLRCKVAGGSTPDVRIVNMLKESRTISRELEAEIRKTIADGYGTILFLNRRGYTYYYHCNSCGHVESCPNCSVALTYHKDTDRMVCHYCGYQTERTGVCSECGSHDMSVSGFGTERVEEEVRKLFPSARTERLDTDVADGDPEVVKGIIERFRDGKTDILLGTQMVAKGLNFPRLRLVGVVLADSTLSVPDFRSEERTFSLLEQVKGRAGRYRDDGRVIIQTYRAENEAIKAVRDSRTGEFYEKELAVRKALGFPPYTRIVTLTLRCRDEEKVRTAIDELYMLSERVISASGYSDVTVIGKGPCVIYKRASSFRYQIIISASDFRHLLKIAEVTVEQFRLPSGVHIEIDVDPLSMI